jgi:hypothetical protein
MLPKSIPKSSQSRPRDHLGSINIRKKTCKSARHSINTRKKTCESLQMTLQSREHDLQLICTDSHVFLRIFMLCRADLHVF